MKTLTDTDKIRRFFPNHTRKMTSNFLMIIHCIVQSRTVCLYKCRDKVSGAIGKNHKAKSGSDYMRLIRFFKMKMIAEFITGIRQLLLSIVKLEDKYLIMDRSNWKIGTKNVNLLTIGGLLKNTFVPLHWLQLDKRGNSNFQERKKLMDNLIGLLQWAGKSVEGMILLADREFIGVLWLEYLCSLPISFVIRLRENLYGELSTITGKKNFAQVLAQTRRTLGHLCGANVYRQTQLYLCNR